MEDFYGVIAIVAVVFGIFQIVLFFKILGMTNDIKDIRNKYIESPCAESSLDSNDKQEQEEPETDLGLKFKVGDLVVDIKKDKQMRVRAIENGKFLCYSNGGSTFDGKFDESEIRLFQTV